MVNRIIVGAHYGLKDWLAQRISAAVMAAYTVILSFDENVFRVQRENVHVQTWPFTHVSMDMNNVKRV
jgi:succinate dehydrogenase hydrophobic anchor subunit